MPASDQTVPDRRTWIARRQLPVYLVLAFGMSWSVWPLVVLNPASSPMVPFGPAIAAIVVTALVGGRRAVLGLLGQLTRWRVGLPWYLAALSPFAITALTGVLAVVTGASSSAAEGFSASLTGLPAVLLSTFVIVGLFEELGWRGYALRTLQRSHSPLWSALVVGAVWLAWHLPELVSDPSGQRPPLPFAVSVLAQSVILTWLYNSTRGSLPVAMLFHAAVNTSAQFLLPQFPDDAYVDVWWLMTGLYVLVAAAVIWRSGARRLTAPARPPRRPADRGTVPVPQPSLVDGPAGQADEPDELGQGGGDRDEGRHLAGVGLAAVRHTTLDRAAMHRSTAATSRLVV